MWKALVGFLVFAAIALYFIFTSGDKMDMQGEAGAHTGAASEHVASASAAASAPSVPAPTAEAAASTASAPASAPAPTMEASASAASK